MVHAVVAVDDSDAVHEFDAAHEFDASCDVVGYGHDLVDVNGLDNLCSHVVAVHLVAHDSRLA